MTVDVQMCNFDLSCAEKTGVIAYLAVKNFTAKDAEIYGRVDEGTVCFRFRHNSVSGFLLVCLNIRIPFRSAASPLLPPDLQISHIRRT